MPFDSLITWIAWGFLAVVSAGRLVAAQTAKFLAKQVFQFWQRVGLPMGSNHVNDTLRRRLQPQHQCGTSRGTGWRRAGGGSALRRTRAVAVSAGDYLRPWRLRAAPSFLL